MSDEREDGAQDELDAISDGGLLRLMLRRERLEAQEKAAETERRIAALGDALREARGGAPRQGPELLHPADYAAMSLDQRYATGMKILKNQVRITTDAPRARDTQPVRRMTRAEIQALPLDERVKVQREVLAGKIQLVG